MPHCTVLKNEAYLERLSEGKARNIESTRQWSSNKTIFSEEKPKVLATKMSEKKDFSSNFMNT